MRAAAWCTKAELIDQMRFTPSAEYAFFQHLSWATAGRDTPVGGAQCRV